MGIYWQKVHEFISISSITYFQFPTHPLYHSQIYNTHTHRSHRHTLTHTHTYTYTIIINAENKHLFGTHPTLYGHSVMLKNFSCLLVSATYQIQRPFSKMVAYGKLGVNRRMSRSRNTINIVNTMLWINAYLLFSWFMGYSYFILFQY